MPPRQPQPQRYRNETQPHPTPEPHHSPLRNHRIESPERRTTVDATSTLGQDGLSRDQLLHLAEHGWVLLEDVIDPDLCRACCDAGGRMETNLTSGRTKDESDRGNTLGYREPHMHDPVFFELYKIPGLLAAARQIVGYDDIRYIESLMTIVSPDQERHTNLEVVNDRRSWGWHRAYRRKDIVTRHDT